MERFTNVFAVDTAAGFTFSTTSPNLFTATTGVYANGTLLDEGQHYTRTSVLITFLISFVAEDVAEAVLDLGSTVITGNQGTITIDVTEEVFAASVIDDTFTANITDDVFVIDTIDEVVAISTTDEPITIATIEEPVLIDSTDEVVEVSVGSADPRIDTIKAIVAASTDFADFKTRIAQL